MTDMASTTASPTETNDNNLDVLDHVLEQSAQNLDARSSNFVHFGQLHFSNGKTYVDIPDDRLEVQSSLVAQSDFISGQVAVMINAQKRAIIVGVLHDPPKHLAKTTAIIDDEITTVTAQREIRLQCGKASISLRHDGRVLIRGTYVCSRATGPNKMKGGSIQLN